VVASYLSRGKGVGKGRGRKKHKRLITGSSRSSPNLKFGKTDGRLGKRKRKGGGFGEERGSGMLPDVLSSCSFQLGSASPCKDGLPLVDLLLAN
jgi:hypothetical protein